jgi:predicted  nucleic acid-binding Zn-ribbon protein
MLNSIKSQIDSLVKLQLIETEIANTKSMLANVHEKIELLDSEIKEYEQAFADESEQTDAMKKKYREHEREVQDRLSHIQKSEIKLNSVKTNKEYQSVLKEIEDLKRKNSDIEDEMIECLDTVDAAEQSLESKREQLLAFTQKINLEKKTIQQKADQNRERLAELEKELRDAFQCIDSDLMEKYKRIQEKHAGGIAIVSVENAVCTGCNVNIPPQMYNELQRCDSLRFCPNCQRIVYWKAG